MLATAMMYLAQTKELAWRFHPTGNPAHALLLIGKSLQIDRVADHMKLGIVRVALAKPEFARRVNRPTRSRRQHLRDN